MELWSLETGCTLALWVRHQGRHYFDKEFGVGVGGEGKGGLEGDFPRKVVLFFVLTE